MVQEVSQQRFEESYGFAVCCVTAKPMNCARAHSTATPTSVPSVNFANYNHQVVDCSKIRSQTAQEKIEADVLRRLAIGPLNTTSGDARVEWAGKGQVEMHESSGQVKGTVQLNKLSASTAMRLSPRKLTIIILTLTLVQRKILKKTLFYSCHCYTLHGLNFFLLFLDAPNIRVTIQSM